MFNFGEYIYWGRPNWSYQGQIQTAEEELRDDIYSIRNLSGYRYKSHNPNNIPRFVNGICTLHEHDYCAKRALEKTADLLNDDLPLRQLGPQVIGTFKNLDCFDLLPLRYSVSDFSKATEYEYPVAVQNVEGIDCPEILSSLADGRSYSLKRSDLAEYDASKLAGFDDLEPMEKGSRIEAPIFKWLQKYLKDHYPQVSIEEDNQIYSNRVYNVLTASVDGLIKIDGKTIGCLEIKSCYGNPRSSGFHIKPDKSIELVHKDEKWRQIQAYLHIMDLQFCLLCTFFDKLQQIALILVRRDSLTFNQIYKAFVYEKFLCNKLAKMFTNNQETREGKQFSFSDGIRKHLAKYICRGIDNPHSILKAAPQEDSPQTSQIRQQHLHRSNQRVLIHRLPMAGCFY